MERYLGLAGFIILCFAAALPGAWFTPGTWYATLHKPSFTPPGWVFGPAWSALYTLMGIAAWRVWLQGGFGAHPAAWAFFLAQLALNALWTILFFGFHRISWALTDIAVLWVTIVVTGLIFRQIDRWAGILWLPYVLWVSFAVVLNAAFRHLNP